MVLILNAAADALLALLYAGFGYGLWRLSRGLKGKAAWPAVSILVGFCALGAASHLAQAVANWATLPGLNVALQAAMALAGIPALVLLWTTFLRFRGSAAEAPSETAASEGGSKTAPIRSDDEAARNVLESQIDERTADLIAANARLEREIRDRKQVQDNLYRAIEEREALLREVHHRVKNNLQLVTSLLNLQIRSEESERLRQKLREAQTRINVLSVVHNKMYAGEDLASVDLSALLPDLCNQIARMQAVDSDRIRLETTAAEVRTDMDHAIPLALLTTEAVSNALKHAFPDGRSGTIRVGLVEDGASVLLRIADDGVGFSPKGDEKPSRGIGLTLIRGMAQQLDGTLDMRTEAGVEIVVTMRRDGLVVRPGMRKSA